jgi:hypothetical protein
VGEATSNAACRFQVGILDRPRDQPDGLGFHGGNPAVGDDHLLRAPHPRQSRQ